ncbi:MAG: hypothetical protein J5636_06095 [Clostridiales bacterium]|nr:hypothetical protein [Clostridiales bacterium]
MSYDISFWKTKRTLTQSPREIYLALSDGEVVDGLCSLPIEEIRSAFEKEFTSWKKDGNFFEKGSQSFELTMTDQSVRVDCYSVEIDNLNRIIDIMLKFECPYYDPSIDTRFG